MPTLIRKFCFYASLIGFMVLACGSLNAFLIGIHRQITASALEAFPKSEISETERRSIVLGSTDADLDEGGLPFTGGSYDQRFHFDNDFTYDGIIANYVAVANLIEHNLAKKERDGYEFGKCLHAVEDFYAHSNYVVVYRDYVAQNGRALVGSIPTLEEVLLSPKEYRVFISMLKKDLRTGRYPLPKWHVIPTETDHGYIIGPGLNKDSVQRPLFVDARETATRASAWYLRLYTRDKVRRKEWARLRSAIYSSGIH
jgi:hypothetical protein